MFIANKIQQLKYTELLLRHVSTIGSSHPQGVPVTKEIYTPEDGYSQYSKHVRVTVLSVLTDPFFC